MTTEQQPLVLHRLDPEGVGLVHALAELERRDHQHLAALERQKDETMRYRQSLTRQVRLTRAALGRLRHLHGLGKLRPEHFDQAVATLFPEATEQAS